MTQRFIAYFRVSTESQEENQSLENQRRRIEAWAAFRDDLEIVEGISAVESATGQTENRRHFKDALRKMHAEDCAGLVVYDLDRFFRNAEEGLRIARTEFIEKGKTLISLNQNLDISSDDGWFTFGIFLLVAEKEAKTMRRRSSEGKAQKQKRAASERRVSFTEGPCPFGFMSIGNRGSKELAIHPEEYPWRQKIFEWHAQGKNSAWIASELNRCKVPTKRGKIWLSGTVRILIRRPMAMASLINQAEAEKQIAGN